jgi:hypothetical protein
VQRFHGLFNGGVVVEAVELENVDVCGAQTSEGVVDAFDDGGSTQPFYSKTNQRTE